ncbi:MAG: hypothetical protein ACFFAN_13125 [Promethearchaeota archaeon]
MNIANSNRRYFMIIAGILLIVVFIFIASSLVIGETIRTDNNAEIANLVPDSNFGYNPKIKSGFDDVSLAKKEDEVIHKSTEKGTIDVTWEYCGPLELCITQDVLDSWGNVLVAKIKGKYEPIGGIVNVTQGDLDLWPWKFEDLPDFGIKWTYWYHEDCYYDYWLGSLVMPPDISYIELASNQWPDGAEPVVPGWPCIPGKKVNFEIDIKYQGCSEEDQQFWLIMTHKN